MTIYCAKCGTENTGEGKFCVNCGEGLEPPKASSRFKGTMMMPGINPEEIARLREANSSPDINTDSSNPSSAPVPLASLDQQALQPVEDEDDEFANQPTLAMPSVTPAELEEKLPENTLQLSAQPTSTQPQDLPLANAPIPSTPLAAENIQANLLDDNLSLPRSSNVKASLLLAFGLLLLAAGGIAGWYYYSVASHPSQTTPPSTEKTP